MSKFGRDGALPEPEKKMSRLKAYSITLGCFAGVTGFGYMVTAHNEITGLICGGAFLVLLICILAENIRNSANGAG